MDIKAKSCCVTGHREIPAEKMDYVKQELKREVQVALEDGYKVFLTGFADGVDIIFAWCVIERRDEYPDIFLEAVMPFANRVKRLKKDERELLSQCNGVKVICEKYQRDCYFQRNRYMVQQSSRIIAVYDGRGDGGTLLTMDYARAMGRDLRIIEM